MGKSAVLLRLAAVGLAAACTPTAEEARPVQQSGFMVYNANGARQAIACDSLPIQLNGNHTSIRLTGACRFVRVAGKHNDIAVDVAPGGTIEITGQHNDVSWRQVRPGPAPLLLDHGPSNSFHPGGAG